MQVAWIPEYIQEICSQMIFHSIIWRPASKGEIFKQLCCLLCEFE